MTYFSSKEYIPAQGLLIRIVDKDRVLTLDYQEATAQHQRSLWWGTAVGYRAMQVAAIALSKDQLWHRENLVVVSAHPGPGVLDSVNYVTQCADRDRLTVMENDNCVSRCNSQMKFEWWVSDEKQTAHVMLNEDFVPDEFYQLIDRRVYSETRADDDKLFELYKVNLSSRIWVAALEENFTVKMLPPLSKGELPSHHVWNKVPA
ncbi:hypothetical protein [Undibacterium pigrum]|uniref:Uncharacterized protein n=1 Tax=Undibacterium pigrum TaxID=401470 RepID=A0A318JI77_9BURK|nr:hypothetical protein [Undibacterium pigrum]PXX47003.1 hypothetical protein DFR42_101579 [Undibacterium pigrum]